MNLGELQRCERPNPKMLRSEESGKNMKKYNFTQGLRAGEVVDIPQSHLPREMFCFCSSMFNVTGRPLI